MSSDRLAELTLGVEEGGVSLEAGDEATGTIAGTEIREFTHDGDDIKYYELKIEEDSSGLEFAPDYPARITPGTALGRLVERFGADLQVGEQIDLHELFEVGQQVQFTIGEEDGEEEGQTFLRAEEDTVRPVGEDLDREGQKAQGNQQAEDQGDDEDDDVRSEVLEMVDEMEGDDESDVKKALAKEGGEYVKAYKSLKSDGDIEVDDGVVFLG